MAKREKSIYDMADSLTRKMAKDKDFMAAWSEYCDQEDFKYLLEQVWGKKRIIAAYYFGVFIIGDFINNYWVVSLVSMDGTQRISPAGTKDFMYPIEDWYKLIYEKWKEMDKEGHTNRNLDQDSKYFGEPENSEVVLEKIRG